MSYFRANSAVAININMITPDGFPITGLAITDLNVTLLKEGVTQNLTGNYSVSEQQDGIYRLVLSANIMLTPDVDYVLIVKDNTAQAIDDKVEFTLYDQTIDSVFYSLKSEININENKLDIINASTDELEGLLKNTTYGLSAIKTNQNDISAKLSITESTLQNEIITQANENEAKIDIANLKLDSLGIKVLANKNAIDIINTSTDELEGLLKNTTYGLEAIKNKTNDLDSLVISSTSTLQNEIITQANENEAKIDTIISLQGSDLSSILNAIAVNTNHLNIIKTYTDELEDLLKNTTSGLSVIKNKTNDIDNNLAIVKSTLQNEIITQANQNEAKIDNVSVQILSAISEVNINESKLDLIISYTDEVEGLLKSATYGLSTLKIKLDDISNQSTVGTSTLQNEIITQANQNEAKIDTIITTISTVESNLTNEINQIPTNPLLTNDIRINKLNYLDTTTSQLPNLTAASTWTYSSRYLSGTSGVNQIDMAGFSSGFLINQDAYINIALVDTTGVSVIGRTYPTSLGIELYKAGVASNVSPTNISVTETFPGNYRVSIDSSLIDIPAIDYLLAVTDTSSIATQQRVEFTAFELTGVTSPKTVTIQVMDSDTLLPIPDTQVYVKNSDMSLIINKGLTGVNGRYITGLQDGSYNVVLRKTFVDYTVPESLSVISDSTVVYYGNSFSASLPSAPSTCIVYGWFVDVSGKAVKGAKAIATETQPARYSGSYKIGKLTKTTLTDTNGYWELELLKSSFLTPVGVKYKLTLSYPGFNYEKNIIVPDSSTADFALL